MQELKPQQTEDVAGARRTRFPITTMMVGEEGGVRRSPRSPWAKKTRS